MRDSSATSAAIRARSPSSKSLRISFSSFSIFRNPPLICAVLIVYKLNFRGGSHDSNAPPLRSTLAFRHCRANFLPSSSRACNRRQAVCRRVLLQSQVGTRRRISEAVQEESLSRAEERNGDGKNHESLDGSAALSHHRRRPMGLPR